MLNGFLSASPTVTELRLQTVHGRAPSSALLRSAPASLASPVKPSWFAVRVLRAPTGCSVPLTHGLAFAPQKAMLNGFLSASPTVTELRLQTVHGRAPSSAIHGLAFAPQKAMLNGFLSASPTVTELRLQTVHGRAPSSAIHGLAFAPQKAMLNGFLSASPTGAHPFST
jgi:predicted membrane protein